MGCGSGGLWAWAWREGWGRTSGLGPNILDWSEEDEQSSVDLARGASSSEGRSRGIRRGCREGAGTSSSPSSWSRQGEKDRWLQKGGKGSPGHRPTSENSLLPTPQPTLASHTEKCQLLSPGVCRSSIGRRVSRSWFLSSHRDSYIPQKESSQGDSSFSGSHASLKAHDPDGVIPFTTFKGTIMIALLNPWGPGWALSGGSQTLQWIA